MKLRARAIRVSLSISLLAAVTSAQVTQVVSRSASGMQGNADSDWSTISADGRYVVFTSDATNLVPGDVNAVSDVFLRDRQLGSTELVSVASDGTQGEFFSGGSASSISPDGRYVAFISSARNLVPGDTDLDYDVFVRDRSSGTTELVSRSSAGVPGNDNSYWAGISSDGRFVAFISAATNLVPGDTNGRFDVFLRDRQTGTTERASVGSGGSQGDGNSRYSAMSYDGRYLAFSSEATNLVSGDANGFEDVFLRDRQSGTTVCLSVSSLGATGNGQSFLPSISADGRFVSFCSAATNLVGSDTNGHADIFVCDRLNGTIELGSLAPGGVQANSYSFYSSISGDGRYLAFVSDASNLVAGDTNADEDVFLRDRQNDTNRWASVDPTGHGGIASSFEATITPDGRYVAFRSESINLAPGDMNKSDDVYVHDSLGAPTFTSLCSPGIDGVVPCPCGNPPSGSDRGCDNSSGTGGAVLAASGGTYLSSDSLSFTTSGERPTALSILLQGTAIANGGLDYGQGVRCVGGTFKRLFVKSAVAGSITAPNFAVGESTVSSRSAYLGDAIQPGQSRWYLVFYRDPIVLGGCPASSTFNATQTGRVTWSP